MPEANNVALRKRQQIETAGRTMFVWVAVAAACIAVAVVLSLSLTQRIMFNQKIINAKNQTVDNLKKDNEAVKTLKDNIRVLNTDAALISTPRLENTEPLSVILDALPSTPNSSALGASLQQKLLNVGGTTLESLTVDPIAGVESTDASGVVDESSTASANEITFQFVVSTTGGQADALKKTLQNLERSIRVIDLTSITLEQQSNKLTLTAHGRAFYEPETTVQLREKSIKP
jgi:heme exporter protein D